jgi:Na+-transporting methylmalonyl-CoA/oxaloacetate decarboxylase gamma subunit
VCFVFLFLLLLPLVVRQQEETPTVLRSSRAAAREPDRLTLRPSVSSYWPLGKW